MNPSEQRRAKDLFDLYERQMLDQARQALIQDPSGGADRIKLDLCLNRRANCNYRGRHAIGFQVAPCLLANPCGGHL